MTALRTATSVFILSAVITIYRYGLILPICCLALRFVPTRYAIRLAKAIHLDVREAWGFERLYFLNNERPLCLRLLILKVYGSLTPVGLGFAWGCAMEAAYRAFNLAWALNEIIRGSLDGERLVKEHLLRNREFILSNLETASYNNHYAFNVFGILVANATLERSDDSYWISELRRVLSEQFNADGSNFEASTSYHQLMVEAVTRLGHLRPDLVPIIKDSMNLSGCLDFYSRVSVLGCHVGDSDGSVVVQDGLNILEAARRIFEVQQEPSSSGAHFPHFGVVFAKRSHIECSLWNPKVGQGGRGGHNHNDCLSLLLSLEDHPFLVDPGVWFYAIGRDHFRRARVHSTPFADGVEPSELAGRFQIVNPGFRGTYVTSGGMEAVYASEAGDLTFKRQIGMVSDEHIECCDSVVGLGKGPVVRLVLAPNIRFDRKGRCLRLMHPAATRSLRVEVDGGAAVWGARREIFAGAYGKADLANVLTYVPDTSTVSWRIRVA